MQLQTGSTRQTAAPRMRCTSPTSRVSVTSCKPRPGERDQVFMSKPRPSLPYQCFVNAIRDRNARHLRKRHFTDLSVPLTRRNAAKPPKHNRRNVSLAAMARDSRRPQPGAGHVRLVVIFAPASGSARLCVDEHHNFIGRRMCLPQQRYRALMQVTASEFRGIGAPPHTNHSMASSAF